MRLRIATPCYGGAVGANYLSSVMAAQAELAKQKVVSSHTILEGESLIPRGRNRLVHKFMKSNNTHLLFWDADIAVDIDDLIKMLAFGELPQYPVIAAPYAKKGIHWENVRKAIRKDPDISDRDLAAVASEYVFNLADELTITNVHEPVKVLEIGTGLMLIQREVFMAMRDGFKGMKYTSQGPGDGDDAGVEMFDYFPAGPHDVSKIKNYGMQSAYLSEDYAFCQRCSAFGIAVWMAPWVKTNHRGMMDYFGDYNRYLEALRGADGRVK